MTRLPWYGYVIGVVVLVLAVSLGAQTWRLHREQDAHASAALAATNAIASADTTRLVYHDSVTRLVARLTVQQPQIPDALDRELKQTRIALQELRATVTALSVTTKSTGNVVADANDSVRHAAFDIRREPYTAHADVALPRSGPGTLDLRVALDSARITVRPGCSDPDAHGIRSATVGVSSPPWLSIVVTKSEQDAGLCRSPAIERTATNQDGRLRLAVVAGYGYTFGVPFAVPMSNAAEWRAFVGLAVAKPIPLPRWLPLH